MEFNISYGNSEEETKKEKPKEVVKQEKYFSAPLDPTTTAAWVSFQDLSTARMVKTIIKKDDRTIFFLKPSKSLSTKLGLREKESTDKRYDRINDYYIFEIPSHWAKCRDEHMLFQRWELFCDWNAEKFMDAHKSDYEELVLENKRLQSQRDSYMAKVNSLLRRVDFIMKHPLIAQKEQMTELSKGVKEFNTLVPTQSNTEGTK